MEIDSIAELQLWLPPAGGCKYILDDGPWDRSPPQWCGAPQLEGSVYCEKHHMRCHAR